MKRIFSFAILVISLVFLSSISLAHGATNQLNSSMKTYFVSFYSSSDSTLIKKHGGKVKKEYKFIPVISAELSDQAVKNLSTNPNVEYIEEDGKVTATEQTIPWGIPDIKAIDVHQNGLTGMGIKIGILDTGIDYTHEDLQVIGGATFVRETTNYIDDNGHGTHVAGIVSSLNNNVGVLGVAPKANLYAIKVLDKYGNGNYSNVIEGIEWAISTHMNIINMSLGGNTASRTLQTAVNKAYQSGILLVASAGNNDYDKKGTIIYPAVYDSVIAVGAVDQLNQRANFSSVGRQLELMAPGVSIESTIPGGYATYSGTSKAAPHVSGVAALVWELNPKLTNKQIRNILNQSAIPLGDNFSYGNGLVNALVAINFSTTSNGSKNH